MYLNLTAGWTVWALTLLRGNEFSLFQNVPTDSEVHRFSYSEATKFFFSPPRVDWPGRDADRSSPPRVERKNEWS